jgi:hypothetical protein
MITSVIFDWVYVLNPNLLRNEPKGRFRLSVPNDNIDNAWETVTQRVEEGFLVSAKYSLVDSMGCENVRLRVYAYIPRKEEVLEILRKNGLEPDEWKPYREKRQRKDITDRVSA